MGPGRRVALALICLSLVAPLAMAGAATDLQAHGYDVDEGDSYLSATRGDGPTIVAVGDDAKELVRDHARSTTSDLHVVLADDAAAAKAWAGDGGASTDPVLVVAGTPDGDPIAQDLTSRLLAGGATDALWDRARRHGVDVADRVDDAHAAGTALAEAGYRPVVVDLGDGPYDAEAADQTRVLLDVADDGLAFHTAHETLQDDDGGEGPHDDPARPSDDGFSLDLILEADFWFEPFWKAGPIQLNLAMSVGIGVIVLSVLGLFGGVKHVTPENALDNDKRASMYDTIEAQPGIHLRELARSEDMNITSASWHIKKLEDVGLIRSQKLEGYKVFYPSQGGREAQRVGVAMNVLRNDNARELLHHVAEAPGSYQREIADELDLNHATVRWHLDKLKQADLVTEVPLPHVTQYYVSAEGLHAIHVVEERGLNGDGDGDVEAEEGARAEEGQAS